MSAVLKQPTPQPDPEVKARAINVEEGALARMVDQGEAALAATLRIFNMGGVLVSMEQVNGATAPLTSATCRVELARSARWVKSIMTKRGPETIPADPPRSVAAGLVEAGAWKTIPALKAVVDRQLWLAPGKAHPGGYDRETGIYCTTRAAALARADASKEEAEEALCVLRGAIKTFPWASECDEAAALASMLAALARPVLEIAPLVLITAPAPGSGKGLLAHAIAQFAQAQPVAGATLSSDDEEVRKDLFSRLLQGRNVILFDEIAAGAGAALDNPALRTLATSPRFSARILGASREAEVSTSATVIITANNATPGADSARRMLEIRLDPRCEAPASRRFEGPEPAEIISGRRGEMVRAVMTIQAAFLQAGRPGLGELPPVSNFRDWNLWARGPVAWLLGIDPAARLVEEQKVDSRAGEIAEALAAIYRQMSTTRWKAGDLLQHHGVADAMREAIGLPPAREPGTRQIGRWLTGARDRIANGLVLREASRAAGSITWRIERV